MIVTTARPLVSIYRELLIGCITGSMMMSVPAAIENVLPPADRLVVPLFKKRAHRAW
ncbi:hypothetical protein [Coriobacterium glomerans]|uniref:hypothetical protein n=1 Tax=Coriobacterium glomerans TaxID=33871 RepID=UPI00155B386D|nr:hypothetical protein [Coriobacterium glomerans]